MRVYVRLSNQADHEAIHVNIDPATTTVGTLRQIAVRQLHSKGDPLGTKPDEFIVLWMGQTLSPSMLLLVLGIRTTDVFVVDKRPTVKREREDGVDHVVPTSVAPPPPPPLSLLIQRGHKAIWLGPNTAGKACDSQPPTHKWTAFVKSPFDDMSLDGVVDQVVFRLHHTFANPVRVVKAPGPFEVSEVGWGQFDMGIEVYFTGMTAPYVMRHWLFLSPVPPPPPPSIPPLGIPIKHVAMTTRSESKQFTFVKEPAESYIVEEVLLYNVPQALADAITSKPKRSPAVIPGEHIQLQEIKQLHKELLGEISKLEGELTSKAAMLLDLGNTISPSYS
eukprot:PhF_6_TR30797/c0_g1_i2/m.45346/K11341/YEATS4, GAS41, YAF9; YEATS domain-containing protein 4